MQGCRCRVRLPEVVASALAAGGLLARHGAGTAMAGALGIGALLARILFSVRNDSGRTAETLEDLIELERKNVKHSPDQIVRIVRLPNGRIAHGLHPTSAAFQGACTSFSHSARSDARAWRDHGFAPCGAHASTAMLCIATVTRAASVQSRNCRATRGLHVVSCARSTVDDASRSCSRSDRMCIR